jgi:HEAT repeat protein
MGALDLKIAELIAKLEGRDELRSGSSRQLLEAIGAPAVEQLCGALMSDVENIRLGATIALGIIGDIRAIEPLYYALKNETVYAHPNYGYGDIPVPVCVFSAISLARFGVLAVEPLTRALKDEFIMCRLNAAAALGDIGGAAAADALYGALWDTDESVCRQAAQALRKIGDPRAPG